MRRVSFIHLLSTVLLCASLMAGAEPTPEGVTRNEAGAVTIHLREADIRAFISAIAELTGRNFVVDPRVKGNVTVIQAAPVDEQALYDIFLSILKVHGFAAIPSGNVTKIVPDATAKQEGQDTPASYVAQGNDALVTAVVPVRHVSAPELVAVLRPLLPQEAHLAGFAASNVLVVADSGANVRRLMRVVAQLDVASSRATELVELRHAEAQDLVKVLASLSTSPGKPPAPLGEVPQFIAYPRTNTLILQASPVELPDLRNLVHNLDVPDRGPHGVEVIPLRFASAIDLVPVLQGILSGESAIGLASGDGGGGAEGASVAAPLRPSSGETSAAIQADEATNTLIIQAPPSQLNTLREVIAKLDVRRNQVLVEGIIAELTTQRGTELGIQWQTSQPDTGIKTGTQLPGAVSGGIGGALGEAGELALLNGFTLGYLRDGDIRALLRAFAGDRYTNVLSTPSLMTLDNAEAEIVVGQNVPFVTGQFTNDATQPDNPFQTIERQDVGILLRVKPQINEGGTVTLQLEQEVSSVDASTQGVDLITNKRSIKTTVLVDDNDIVVLGGLIQNNLTENEQKVPWVGDIPLLGYLFRNTRDDNTRTNLMVFLRPTIVDDESDNRAIAAQRYEGIRARRAEEEPARRKNLHRRTAPELPPLDGLIE